MDDKCLLNRFIYRKHCFQSQAPFFMFYDRYYCTTKKKFCADRMPREIDKKHVMCELQIKFRKKLNGIAL